MCEFFKITLIKQIAHKQNTMRAKQRYITGREITSCLLVSCRKTYQQFVVSMCLLSKNQSKIESRMLINTVYTAYFSGDCDHNVNLGKGHPNVEIQVEI